MTIASYNKLKQALIQLRREVTSSPEAASRFINELGLRDIVISAETPSQKTTSRKTTPKKAATR